VRYPIRDRILGAHDGKHVDLTLDPAFPDIPPPDPTILLLHSSVAKILKISGRGEKLETSGEIVIKGRLLNLMDRRLEPGVLLRHSLFQIDALPNPSISDPSNESDEDNEK
jgi:hypothetical protein